jgi:hypothetical protein
MSAILKGLLQPQIASVVAANTTATAASAGDVTAQRAKLVDELATAIAIAVQQYLLQSVTVIPGQAVTVATKGGPSSQTGGGITVSSGKLNAP